MTRSTRTSLPSSPGGWDVQNAPVTTIAPLIGSFILSAVQSRKQDLSAGGSDSERSWNQALPMSPGYSFKMNWPVFCHLRIARAFPSHQTIGHIARRVRRPSSHRISHGESASACAVHYVFFEFSSRRKRSSRFRADRLCFRTASTSFKSPSTHWSSERGRRSR